jgi:hypothetical protein
VLNIDFSVCFRRHGPHQSVKPTHQLDTEPLIPFPERVVLHVVPACTGLQLWCFCR